MRWSVANVECVLLIVSPLDSVPKVDAWRSACREQDFQCVTLSHDFGETLVEHLWERTHVVAVPGPGVRLEQLAVLRRKATHALVVLSASPSTPPLDVSKELGCIVLQSGQESTLLRWCRQQLNQRRGVHAIPRPHAVVNLTERTLVLEGEVVPLQPREAQLLAILANFAPSPCPSDVACQLLLGGSDEAKRRLLRQHLYQLRQKLGRHAALLQYVRGEGYRCFLDLRLVEMT